MTITDSSVDGPHGPIPIRSYLPEAAQDAAGAGLVWIHGGAFQVGDLDVPEADWVSRCLAAAGIAVVTVGYRLAVDGVHFPVPSDDVLAVWRWATIEDRLGVPGAAWHIGGGSAGGNLAASVTQQARDGRAPLPRSSILIYPVLHDELPAPSPELAARLDTLPAEQRFSPELTRDLNLNYVGDPALLKHPYAFPAHGEARGLPPTLIVNSDLDDLRPSGESYGAQLAIGGVDVTVVRELDVTHGHLNEPDSPGAQRTVARILTWILQLVSEPS
jgi:acetyl esterase/lipase